MTSSSSIDRTAAPAARVGLPWLYVAASCALTLVLVVWFAGHLRLPLGEAMRRLAGFDVGRLAIIVALTAVNGWIGAVKWRLCNIEGLERAPGRLSSFALTAVAMGLGQILPSQIAGALARSVGAHIGGATSAARGGATTVFEQSFDVIIVFYLAGASLVAWLSGAGAAVFWPAAVLFTLIGLAATEGAFRLANAHLSKLPPDGEGRLLAMARAIVRSGCADRALGRRLYVLSLARFVVFVLIAVEIAQGIHVGLPLWMLTAALPFAVMAIALVATPGGLGANEAAMTGALTALGAPLDGALQWAIAARLVVLAAGLCVGAFGLALFTAITSIRKWRGQAAEPI
jgi:hypothetical protein